MTKFAIVVEVEARTPTDARRILTHALRAESATFSIHEPRDGHEIRISEQPTREQLADWTEPW